MDPSSLVVSMITFLIQYLNSPSNQKIEDIDAFYEFLIDRNQKQLLDGLKTNELAGVEIKQILKRDHSEVLSILLAISEKVATMSANTELLSGFVSAVSPGTSSDLTSQQKRILHEIYVVGGGKATFLSEELARPAEIVTGGGSFQPKEPNYLIDDMATLVSLGLLIEDFNSHGNPIWKGTRAGQELARTLGVIVDME